MAGWLDFMNGWMMEWIEEERTVAGSKIVFDYLQQASKKQVLPLRLVYLSRRLFGSRL